MLDHFGNTKYFNQPSNKLLSYVCKDHVAPISDETIPKFLPSDLISDSYSDIFSYTYFYSYSDSCKPAVPNMSGAVTP